MIPRAVLTGFEYYTKAIYGKGLFFEAFNYANKQTPKALINYFDNTLIGLSFLGGCFPVALFLVAFAGKIWTRLMVSIAAVFLVSLILLRDDIGGHLIAGDIGFNINLVDHSIICFGIRFHVHIKY